MKARKIFWINYRKSKGNKIQIKPCDKDIMKIIYIKCTVTIIYLDFDSRLNY